MKRKIFKVKEKYIIEQWTYIYASTEEEAQKLLKDEGSSFEEIVYKNQETDWSTLQEIKDWWNKK